MIKKYLVCALVFVCGDVLSDCGDDSNNDYQLANCDFDMNFSGWAASPGIASTSTDDFQSSGSSGSVAISSEELIPSALNVATLSQCFDKVTDMSAKTAGTWFKSNSADPFDCKTLTQFYGGAACTLTNLGQCESAFVTLTDGSAWTNVNCNTPVLTGNAASIKMTFSCSNGSFSSGPSQTAAAFSVLIDNAYVVPLGGMPVELMEFSID